MAACKWKEYEERKEKERELQLPGFDAWFYLPNCYIRQANPSQASLEMGSAHEGEEGII